MTERLMAKLDRLGAEAGIKQMTPEIYRFSMLVRADVVAQWPQREWVSLTDEDKHEIELSAGITEDDDGYIVSQMFKLIDAKLREMNT